MTAAALVALARKAARFYFEEAAPRGYWTLLVASASGGLCVSNEAGRSFGGGSAEDEVFRIRLWAENTASERALTEALLRSRIVARRNRGGVYAYLDVEDDERPEWSAPTEAAAVSGLLDTLLGEVTA